MRPGETSFEILGDDGLIACCSQRAIAHLLAAEWLRDPLQRSAGIRTCVFRTRDADGHVQDEHIIALAGVSRKAF